jgi:putative ABC transport system permease protein
MSLWRIAWSYLWNRKLTTSMTILSVALGVALISAVLTLREETRRRFEEEGQAFDLVVGAKENGPLNLVLSTVYFLDVPRGVIDADLLGELRAQEEVAGAFPVGMGDTYRGYRIVGTTPELFAFDWGEKRLSPYRIGDGRLFEKPFEAVIGARVAEETGLGVGSEFISTHGYIDMPGMTHDAHPYTVTGVMDLSGTPNDRAIFTDMKSIWDAHAHPEEEAAAHGAQAEAAHGEHAHEHEHAHDHGKKLTAVLVKLHSPAQRFRFVDRVNKTMDDVMAVIPVNEIRKLYDQLLGIAKTVLLAIGYLVVVISAISILIGLYMAILQRKRDLAVMRALGASRGEIFGAVIIEAFWVTVLGLAAGWVLGGGVCYVLGRFFMARVGFQIAAVAWTPDLISAFSAVLLMGLIAGILPAWQAYRSDVAKDLAEL